MVSAEDFETRTVHVLRHRFEMSVPLAQSFGRFIKSNARQRVQVFATKQVSLEGFEYYGSKYDTVLTEAHEAFRAHEEPLHLDGSLRLKKVNNNMVRIAFKAKEQRLLDIQLQDVEDKVASFADLPQNRNRLEGIVAASTTPQNYLYVDVSEGAIVDDLVQFEEAKEAFQAAVVSPVEGRLHYVSPLSIVGYDKLVKLPALKPVNEWQDAS